MRHLSSHDAVSGADNNDEAGPRRSAACGARRVRSRRFQAGLGRLSEAGPRGADGAPLVERGGFVGSGWSAAVGAKRVHGERDDGEVGPWGARHSHRGETGSGVWPPDPSSYSPAPPDLGGMDAAAGRIREGGRGHERESEESAYLGRLLENAEFWVSTRLASATQMNEWVSDLGEGCWRQSYSRFRKLYSRKRTPGWATGSEWGYQPGVYVTFCNSDGRAPLCRAPAAHGKP
jgi:hypothetical protein